MLPWLICGGLAALALVLRIQLRLLQKSLDDITDPLGSGLVKLGEFIKVTYKSTGETRR